MKYTIPFTDTTKTPISIEQNSINDDTILRLYGKSSINYGAELWINLIKLLDNSCSGGINNPGPSKPVEGQLWYNNYSTNLTLYKTNKWVPIVDSQYLDSLYGAGGIEGLIKKLSEALYDDTNPAIVAFITELNKYLLPLSGGTISGKLYIPKISSYAAFYDKAKLNDENKVVSIEYLKWFVLEFAKNFIPPNSPGFDDSPFGIGYDTDPSLLPEVSEYVPLVIASPITMEGNDVTFTNTVKAITKASIDVVVDNSDVINKKYADDKTSSESLMNVLKNSTGLTNAISSRIDDLIKAPDAPTAPTAPTLKSYNITDSDAKNGKGTTTVATGLTLSITPQSANSKFLIIVSLSLSNGTKTGTAMGSLYKNNIILLNNFCIVDGTNLDSLPYSVSFIDSVSSTDIVTYTVKVSGDAVSSEWFVNQSADTINKSTSSMTIMEFVGNATITGSASSTSSTPSISSTSSTSTTTTSATSGTSSTSTTTTNATAGISPTSTTTSSTSVATSTTTTIAKAVVGDALAGGFYIGDITDGGVKYKLILSPKSTELNMQYIINKSGSVGNRTNNTPSYTNGPENTRITSQNVLDGFSAAWYCSKLDINGYSDWYLPAADELVVMSINRKTFITGPNKLEWFTTFTGGSGSFTAYSGGFYWSSTDNGKISTALRVDCRNYASSAVTEVKETVSHVRAIRREPY